MIKYSSYKYDLNCSEVLIYAANEEYEMNLTKETLKTMAGFGGGMSVGGTCGAIIAAITVLGLLFTKDRAHEDVKVSLYTEEFYNEFKQAMLSDNCIELKEKHRDDEDGCSMIIMKAADILDGIVKREKK